VNICFGQNGGNMDKKQLKTKLQEFVDNEARSCSMDFGCVTPLYVYRMWGGSVELEDIEKAFVKLKCYDC
jgi:hypothetical protein